MASPCRLAHHINLLLYVDHTRRDIENGEFLVRIHRGQLERAFPACISSGQHAAVAEEWDPSTLVDFAEERIDR